MPPSSDFAFISFKAYGDSETSPDAERDWFAKLAAPHPRSQLRRRQCFGIPFSFPFWGRFILIFQ